MSIASEITRIAGNVADSYTAANAKGATMPATQDSDHLAATIATIPSGITPTGTMYIISNGTYNVEDKAIANVNVPTTAPAHYVEKAVDANGKLVGSTNIINLNGVTDIGPYALAYDYYTVAFPANTTIDLSSLTTISGQYGCQYMFNGCTGLTSVDLSSLTTVSGSYACYNMFYQSTIAGALDLSSLTTISGQYGCNNMFMGCEWLTSVDLSSLTTVSENYACDSMFAGCTRITTVDMSSLVTLSANFGCRTMFYGCTGLTTVNLHSLTSIARNQVCYQMFYGCNSLVNLDISSLTTIEGTCREMFYNCISLTSVNLSSLTAIQTGNGTVHSMFYGCTGLTSVDLSSLTVIKDGGNQCSSMFRGCTSLTSVDFSSLTTILSASGFGSTFYGCSSLTTLSFPSVTPNSFTGNVNALGYMCSNIPNITLHFPSNAQAAVEALAGYSTTAPFGAVAGTVLFDLPATYTLTGADTVTYTRNPKYDTTTALAWKVGAYGTTDFTPAYYTSGTTDPAVSDTIYSDAACTTAVTTISAIA